MIIRFLSVAYQEYHEAVQYYNREKPGLGFEFASAVDIAIEHIVEYPKAWPLISPRIRRYRILRFPYGVLYHVKGNDLLIVGIMHLHRDPKSYEERL